MKKLGKENLTYADGITWNMTKTTYWKGLLSEQNKELLISEEIEKINKQINGEKIDDYTAESGSTIIILSKEFMSSLSEGEHTLKVAFNNGKSAETKFIIVKVSTVIDENSTSNEDTTLTITKNKTITTTSNNPKTGDNITIWISLMVISMLGIGVVGTVKFTKKK